MNAKQRVQRALAKSPVDRTPVFMWYQPSTVRRLAEVLELPGAQVAEALGNDVRQAWVNNNYAMEGIVHERDGEGHVDFWGIHWRKEGEFNQAVKFPLEDADEAAVNAYEFPYAAVDELLAQMAPLIEFRGTHFIGVDVSPCAFEMYWRLRGLEQGLLDLADQPALADALLGRCAEFAVRLAEAACERYPVDWLWTGDDIAGQQGMLMSPDIWRALIKPHLARVTAVGKTLGLPVAYHCCGALRPIIPDLIEIGVDVLNPIQCNCPGMDPLELKAEFGAVLAFMGGVDTQGLLPTATPSEVRRATERLIEGMTADGGGFILAASHTVPPETPLENIFAMYEAAGLMREAIFDRAAQLRNSQVREPVRQKMPQTES